MDLSEIHPVFLYASSQNDFVHQNLPEHTISHEQQKPQQHQTNSPRQTFLDSSSVIIHNERNNKPRYNHPSPFGNHPKPSANRQGTSNHHQNKLRSSSHKNQQRPNQPRPRFQSPVYQSATRLEKPYQNKPFSENMNLQASVQQSRQQSNAFSTLSYQNGHTDFNQAFNYPTQTFMSPEKKFASQTSDRNQAFNYPTQTFISPEKKHISQTSDHNQAFSYPTQTFVLPEKKFIPQTSDHNEALNYHAQTFTSPEKKRVSHISDHRSNRNNQGIRNTYREARRNPTVKSHNQNPQIKEEHRQESVRKHVAFEETPQVFHNRNVHNRENNNKFTPKVSNGFSGQNSPHRNRNNERLNLQTHARSMRGEKPQLPPRPSFENGGVKINNLASELPILHLDSITEITENPAVLLQEGDSHDHSASDEYEKKTYILIKAPTVETTESPTSTPFVVENLQHASPSYIVSNLPHTSVHHPEVYSSPVEPRALPQNEEPPAIVLDLVQIPDHATYSHPDKPLVESNPSTKFRSAVKEEDEFMKHFRPTENSATASLRSYDDSFHQSKDDFMKHFHPTENSATASLRSYDDSFHQSTKVYSPLPEDSPNFQSKAISKPKVKESTRFANHSSLPVTYSSSVSVVSIKQNVDQKQQATKKPKTTLKKAVNYKRKPKIPENDDFINDYNYESQSVPGEPGVDYPNYKDIPATSFNCKNIKSPGFYADIEASCQV